MKFYNGPMRNFSKSLLALNVLNKEATPAKSNFATISIPTGKNEDHGSSYWVMCAS